MATALDVCCGSRMFWYNKNDGRALFLDNRTVDTVFLGKRIVVAPDMLADFRELPFPDCSFPLVVFDPPHLRWAGQTSMMRMQYGQLFENWRDDLRLGFAECFRVLIPLGTLVFKWSESQIRINDVLELTPEKPLFGNRRGGTIWCVFQKTEGRE
jgi:SAM-dependent methyltransferase